MAIKNGVCYNTRGVSFLESNMGESSFEVAHLCQTTVGGEEETSGYLSFFRL